MANGIAVDANVMASFARSTLDEQPSNAIDLVNLIKTASNFAIDNGQRIQTQWFQTCGAPFFKEWFVQGLRDGYVRTVSTTLNAIHRRRLVQKCGFPAKRFEMVYIEVADAADERYLVSDDIDFYEPKLKKAKAKAKEKAKINRNGCVCRYLRKELNIVVGYIPTALEEIPNVCQKS